ncbi:hypothetical protein EPUS_02644 [Endocarpon pusillum Z07020]|uniref:3-ketosteroid reductase n=1 Tax=Endocarpon pusillum (strain Z07020 / HMAS-L-300199) TaxID=1263415 RepID=U1GGX5_ENDPU|nr:uncharacterized protein EPUS_02644 [Endocarpon pusillum Z07020]ERF76932.1 hypothetical protein EPUS_02644 [Endocarpon pusillum Z07020]
MSSDRVSPKSHNTYVLVTGANSGLGLATCCRLIDEFLDSRPPTHQLTLVFTTRDDRKGSATLAALKKHESNHKTILPRVRISHPPIFFRSENLELTSLLSIRALTQRLLRSAIPRLDAIILNAGVGGFVGIKWPQAFWTAGTDLVEATTWPTFKLSATGLITPPQLPSSTRPDREDEEPVLGEIFCANIFGHYLLTHWLMPLLRACPHSHPARIIWLSSIEAQPHHFNPSDIQALTSRNAYEHAKRMTDLLALTSSTENRATSKSVHSFLSLPSPTDRRLTNNPCPSKPTIHVAHPGICATSIVPLPFLLNLLMILAPSTLPASIPSPPTSAGPAKWGSAVTRWGRGSVQRTDVSGWGLSGDGGVVEWWQAGPGWLGGWGRKRGARDATREDVEGFVEEGQLVWRELEALREVWEGRIEEYERSEKKAE